jgi:hypothetical protein
MGIISDKKIQMNFNVTLIDTEAEQYSNFELLGSVNFF